jgi:hypothetical protein
MLIAAAKEPVNNGRVPRLKIALHPIAGGTQSLQRTGLKILNQAMKLYAHYLSFIAYTDANAQLQLLIAFDCITFGRRFMR